MTAALVALFFLEAWRHYHPGEIAGFPPDQAASLIEAVIARRHVLGAPVEDDLADLFDPMSRADLIAYGRLHFGVTEDPPEHASDDDLRDYLRMMAAAPAEGVEGGGSGDAAAKDTAERQPAPKGRGRKAVAPAPTPPSETPAPPPSPAGDQLDVMDRVHLEALAKDKLGLDAIDPELTDDELRAQIRAIAETL